VINTSKRAADCRSRIQVAEESVKIIYWTMGRYDVVIAFDPIDKATAAALMMGVCAIENVFNQTLRAITEDEIEGVLDKSS